MNASDEAKLQVADDVLPRFRGQLASYELEMKRLTYLRDNAPNDDLRAAFEGQLRSIQNELWVAQASVQFLETEKAALEAKVRSAKPSDKQGETPDGQ